VRLFSYVVARDYGFAPNPFYGICTLATCKPVIRRTAVISDWIVGTGSAERSRRGHLVFAMQVAEITTFDDYWRDPRFAAKKPIMSGSIKQAFGDNIYHRETEDGPWLQANSHHSFADGTINQANVTTDTGTRNVLIGSDFIYFGGAGPAIPARLRDFDDQDLCQYGRGHKSTFSPPFVEAVVDWLRSLDATGYVGAPLEWSYMDRQQRRARTAR